MPSDSDSNGAGGGGACGAWRARRSEPHAPVPTRAHAVAARRQVQARLLAICCLCYAVNADPCRILPTPTMLETGLLALVPPPIVDASTPFRRIASCIGVPTADIRGCAMAQGADPGQGASTAGQRRRAAGAVGRRRARGHSIPGAPRHETGAASVRETC